MMPASCGAYTDVIYRITGAFFFGAAASIGSVLDRISDTHRALIVDFAAVLFLDSTGANVIGGLARNARKRGVRLYLSGTGPDVRRVLEAYGIDAPEVTLAASVDAALRMERDVAAG
jgi:SulP family sulfate permease